MNPAYLSVLDARRWPLPILAMRDAGPRISAYLRPMVRGFYTIICQIQCLCCAFRMALATWHGYSRHAIVRDWLH